MYPPRALFPCSSRQGTGCSLYGLKEAWCSSVTLHIRADAVVGLRQGSWGGEGKGEGKPRTPAFEEQYHFRRILSPLSNALHLPASSSL